MAAQATDSPARGPAQPGFWGRLAERLNPANERPKAWDGLVASRLVTVRGEAYYIVKNPRCGTYVRLELDEYFLLGLMDGSRQVKDLVLAYFLQYKRFAFRGITLVVAELRRHGFLRDEPLDTWVLLADRLARRTWAYRVDRLVRAFLYREFPVLGVDGALSAAYRRVGWVFFTRPALALLGLLCVGGSILFVWEVARAERDPFRLGGSPAAGLLALLALSALPLAVHEAGHALATKHYGRAVNRGGFMLYLGMPAFFVDTTDICLEPRRPRMVVSAAGIIAVWALGGLAMFYVVLQPQSAVAAVAFQLAFVAFVNESINLLPLVELDGYYLLMDWLEMPLLRARALAFVRRELWRKLRDREPLNREEQVFAVFGVLAIVGTVLIVAAAIYFWLNGLQGLVVDLWTQEGPAARILVVLLVLGIGVPLLFGLGVELRQVLRWTRGRLTRLRWRGEASRAQTRRDARELVCRLSFLGDLIPDEREAVVTELRTERFRPGEYVVREGEPGEHFYLISGGQAEVLKLNDDCSPRRLAVLRRGDYFGELALLESHPRFASVRALTGLDVFVLDRQHFETSIAPKLREYGLTVQFLEERDELSRMELFRETPPSELDSILARLASEELPDGADIIRQGEPGDRFYVIRRGLVEVIRLDADGQEQILGQLSPGDHFGEMALLSDSPRMATVRALEPVALWSLDRAGFDELLLGELQLEAALSAKAEWRQSTHLRLAGEPAA